MGTGSCDGLTAGQVWKLSLPWEEQLVHISLLSLSRCWRFRLPLSPFLSSSSPSHGVNRYFFNKLKLGIWYSNMPVRSGAFGLPFHQSARTKVIKNLTQEFVAWSPNWTEQSADYVFHWTMRSSVPFWTIFITWVRFVSYCWELHKTIISAISTVANNVLSNSCC